MITIDQKARLHMCGYSNGRKAISNVDEKELMEWLKKDIATICYIWEDYQERSHRDKWCIRLYDGGAVRHKDLTEALVMAVEAVMKKGV